MQVIGLSHVALLVPSVRKAADYLSPFYFKIEKEEEWPGEGTREIYVEREKANALLLVEPISPGPYQRAMDKRGPGLHHLAIDVRDVKTYLNEISNSGWLLHPKSIETLEKTRSVYLSRPGFPALIEVKETKEFSDRPLFIDEIGLPVPTELFGLRNAIGMEKILIRSEKFSLRAQGRALNLFS